MRSVKVNENEFRRKSNREIQQEIKEYIVKKIKQPRVQLLGHVLTAETNSMIYSILKW